MTLGPAGSRCCLRLGKLPQATHAEEPDAAPAGQRTQLLMMMLIMFVTMVLPTFLASYEETQFSLRKQG